MTVCRRTPAVLVTAATPPTGDRLRAAVSAPVTASPGPNTPRCRPRARTAPTRPTHPPETTGIPRHEPANPS